MKITSLFLSIFSMIHFSFVPLADAKQAQDRFENLKTYFELTGLTKNEQTVGSLLKVMNGQTHPNDHKLLSQAFSQISKMKIPKFKAQKVKEGGVEFVRLFVQIDKQQKIIDVYDTEKIFLKIGSIVITPQDAMQVVPMFEKFDEAFGTRSLASQSVAAKAKLEFNLDPNVYDKLNKKEKLEFKFKLRELIDSSEKIHFLRNGTEVKTTAYYELYKLLVGEAFALDKQACIFAGHVSSYGTYKDKDGKTKYSCGVKDEQFRSETGKLRKGCGAQQIACNTSVFGYDRAVNDGSKPICVNYDPPEYRRYATQKCNDLSPISSAKDKADFIKSFGKKDPTADDIKAYIAEVKQGVAEAMKYCGEESTDVNKAIDQADACKHLRGRMLAIKTFACDALEDKAKPGETIPRMCEGINLGDKDPQICPADQKDITGECLQNQGDGQNQPPKEDPEVAQCSARGGEYKNAACFCAGRVAPLMAGETCGSVSGSNGTSGSSSDKPGFLSKIGGWFARNWIPIAVISTMFITYKYFKKKDKGHKYEGILQNDDLTDRSQPIMEDPGTIFRPSPGIGN